MSFQPKGSAVTLTCPNIGGTLHLAAGLFNQTTQINANVSYTQITGENRIILRI